MARIATHWRAASSRAAASRSSCARPSLKARAWHTRAKLSQPRSLANQSSMSCSVNEGGSGHTRHAGGSSTGGADATASVSSTGAPNNATGCAAAATADATASVSSTGAPNNATGCAAAATTVARTNDSVAAAAAAAAAIAAIRASASAASALAITRAAVAKCSPSRCRMNCRSQTRVCACHQTLLRLWTSSGSSTRRRPSAPSIIPAPATNERVRPSR